MLYIKKLVPEAKVPTRNNPTDGGIDLYSIEDFSINPGQTVKIRTGISIELDHVSMEGSFFDVTKCPVSLIWDRSGLGSKGIHRLAGVIDVGYRGEIIVCLTNLNIDKVLEALVFQTDKSVIRQAWDHSIYYGSAGDKIAQLLIQDVYLHNIQVKDELSETERGGKGFGSSGN